MNNPFLFFPVFYTIKEMLEVNGSVSNAMATYRCAALYYCSALAADASNLPCCIRYVNVCFYVQGQHL